MLRARHCEAPRHRGEREDQAPALTRGQSRDHRQLPGVHLRTRAGRPRISAWHPHGTTTGCAKKLSFRHAGRVLRFATRATSSAYIALNPAADSKSIGCAVSSLSLW